MHPQLWYLAPFLFYQLATVDAAQARGIDVAITVDDMPADADAIEAIMHALADYHVGPTLAFVTGARATSQDTALALKAWYAGGHRLGTSTYGYSDAAQSGVDAFLADVARNEDVLDTITGESHSWRILRYPFLQEGARPEDRRAIRDALIERDYRVAQVTVDPSDRAWDAAYARCVEQGDTGMAYTIQRGMVADTLLQLLWADEAARFIFGRPIKQILTLHAGTLLAANAGELLQALREHRVRFIDIDAALEDAAYKEPPPDDAAPLAANLLARIIAARGLVDAPRPMEHPTAWLSQQCVGGEQSPVNP